MGAWTFVEPQLRRVLDGRGTRRLALCRTPGFGLTATGLMKKHRAARQHCSTRRSAEMNRPPITLTRLGKRHGHGNPRPTLGESVTEATIGKWFKKPGDAVAVDEPLVELETDKVTIEVPAPAAGVLEQIAVKDGETVGVGALLGRSRTARRRRHRPRRRAARLRKCRSREDEARPQTPSMSRRSRTTPKAAGKPPASQCRKLLGRS